MSAKEMIKKTEGREARAFRSADEMLEAAGELFRLRYELTQANPLVSPEEAKKAAGLTAVTRRLQRQWRARLALSAELVPVADRVRRLRLNQIETEVLMVLLLGALGLADRRIDDVGDVIQSLALPPSRAIAALRALSESGKLYKKGVIYYDDPEETLRDRDLILDPAMVDLVLHGAQRPGAFAQVRREADLYEAMSRITGIMQKKSDELRNLMRGYSRQADFLKWRMKLDTLLHALDSALRPRPTWQLRRMQTEHRLCVEDWAILIALTGKALHHLTPEDDLFTGGGLARAVCDTPRQYNHRIKRLLADAPLLRGGYIQPCGGAGQLFSENAEAVRKTEFELTERTLKALGLENAREGEALRDSALRSPQLGLQDLALPDKTRAAVELALDHVRHADTLMETWGLRSAFPYGRGVTMLFHGPPGTGKTATAEALARELEKSLLVADYAKVQNCFVGQTEKNITRLFQKARQYDAVLFWDEADAMFFDRDKASQAWEVRDVNVLLQEIERFEGVCILATNRKITLDKALERRISAKVEFPRPDRALRLAIWRKLLPKQLPLAANVDIARLSQTNLAGGEIKNVILNASRFACGRSGGRCVTAEDFDRAMTMEAKERWASPAGRAPIGFNRRGAAT